jgi:hypothetical protein
MSDKKGERTMVPPIQGLVSGLSNHKKRREAPDLKTFFTSVVVGIFGAILGAFPIAALVALFFRFPVPFGGYLSGPSAIEPSIFAVIFLGFVCGGFPLLAFLGAIGGIIAFAIGGPKKKFVLYLSLVLALAVDLVAVLVMAVLGGN